MKSWPKVKLGQVEVSSNIFQYHSSNPYEVISGHYLPKAYDKFTKSEIRTSWRSLLKITRLAYRKSYLAVIGPNPHEKLTKYEIRQSYHLLQFCFIDPYLVPYYFCPYLALLTNIYHYLPIIGINYPYLVIFALDCPDLTMF